MNEPIEVPTRPTGLTLRAVAPRRGLVWVQQSFKAFFTRPLALSLLLFVFFTIAGLLAGTLPVVGSYLVMFTPPLLSLLYMIATRDVASVRTVVPAQLFEPFTAREPARRKRLLVLCVLYGAVVTAVLLAVEALDAGRFVRLQELMMAPQTDATRTQLEALLADGRLGDAALLLAVGFSIVSVPFWHAPALVWWGGQGVAQALFSSTLACWRTKGAFAVYTLTWLTLFLIFGLFTGTLLALLGAPQLAVLTTVPAGLLFTVLFYVSLYFNFADTFGEPATAAAVSSS